MDVEVYYPNSYIFCCSMLESGVAPNPSAVSPEYDSFYKISEQNINSFADAMADLLRQNLAIGDLSLENEKMVGSHILTLGQPFNVRCLHGPVEYAKDKIIALNTAEDFGENHWIKIFYKSMLKKNDTYAADREYRFVFIIEHPTHRFLPVVPTPKLLNLSPVRSLVS